MSGIENKVYQIEDFETTVGNEPTEIAEEAVALIAELEAQGMALAGQKSLVTQTEHGTVTRCPFREMNEDEKFVYGLLLPEHVKVTEFDDPMPVEVLRKLKRAKEFFPCFRVWRKAKGQPDPILVGYIGEESWGGTKGEPHIIIRWGEVLDEWPALVKQAAVAFRAKVAEACNEIIAKATVRLASAKTLPDDALPTDRSIPHSY